MRRALFQIHLWTGLGVGLYILVISISGSLIVFRREFDRLLCPNIIMVPAAGARLSDAELIARARRAYPNSNYSRYSQIEIRGAREPGAAVELWFTGGTLRVERLFDPYSGKLLGDAVACEPRGVTWLADLHDYLVEGRTGLWVNGMGAIATVLMCASGAILWWPGRRRWWRSIVIQRAARGRRFIAQLHSVMGFWVFALLLFWGITGIYFAFPAPFNALVDVFTVQGAETPASLWLEGALEWVARAHFGRSFGLGVKATWAVLGLVPGALFVTGLLMWWGRVLRPARPQGA